MGPKRIFSNAIYFLPVPASGLRDLKVYIPDTVLRGHNIQFNCTFTLEDEKLFAIKWYRGNYEIFRYMPSSPAVPKKTFPLDGYNVSVSLNCFLNDYKGAKRWKPFCDNMSQLRFFQLKLFWTQSCKYANLQWSVADQKKYFLGFITPENVRKPLFKEALTPPLQPIPWQRQQTEGRFMCKSFFSGLFRSSISIFSNFSNFADGALDRLCSVHVRRQIH